MRYRDHHDDKVLRTYVSALNRRAQTAAHRLAFVRPGDRVFRAFQISGIDTLLPFEPADAEADA